MAATGSPRRVPVVSAIKNTQADHEPGSSAWRAPNSSFATMLFGRSKPARGGLSVRGPAQVSRLPANQSQDRADDFEPMVDALWGEVARFAEPVAPVRDMSPPDSAQCMQVYGFFELVDISTCFILGLLRITFAFSHFSYAHSIVGSDLFSR